MTKTVAFTMLFVFVLAALVGGGAVYYLRGSPSVTHVTINIDKIRDIAQLATAEYTLSAWADQEYKSNIGFTKVPSDYLIIICTGKVQGSVDLGKEKMTINANHETREISVNFKRGSVMVSAVSLDDDATQRISCREKLPQLFNLTKPAQETEKLALVNVAKAKIREAAIKNGIVDKTKENAKTALTNFFAACGYTGNITFDEPAYEPGGK